MQLGESVSNMREAIALLHHASPQALRFAIAANLVIGLIPSVLIYTGAQLMERGSSGSPAETLFGLLFCYVLLSAFHDSVGAISSFVVDTLQDASRMMIKQNVISTISTFPDLSIHETAERRELAVLSARTGENIGNFVSHFYAVSVGFVMVIPNLLLTGGIAWWIPLFMLAGMAPVVLVRAKSERASWDVQEKHAATFNELRLLERILIEPTFAKDLRIYHMQNSILCNWKIRYGSFLTAIRRVRIENSMKLIATSIFSGACLGVPLFHVVSGFVAGNLSIAQLSIFLGALLQLKEGLAAIIFNFGDMLGLSHSLNPYRQLMKLTKFHRPTDAGLDARPSQCLALEQVCFSYETSPEPVLCGIQLSIPLGHTVAIVGDNGAGKTSLLKLLCGLYQPTSGKLKFPGHGKEPNVIGVFQDFARFPLTPLENLGTTDRARAIQCLTAVGLQFLSLQLDIPLTSEMPNGIDLSGGQWQRLAIARAMVHADNSNLLLFDEPTSALDPESEMEIMQHILKLCAGRTAIIVSHRLALTRFVDRIIVLDKGQVLEDGAHEKLMALNGKYAKMFRSQAGLYV